MKSKHRKAPSANGKLDAMAILAEQYASYLTRRNAPPHVTLERIANLAEKAINYQHTRVDRHGKTVPDVRPYLNEGREAERDKCIARIWKAYQVVQESEIMHKAVKGKDETWGGAKEVNGHWISEPVTYYGDQFENVLADELHGYTAQGRTPIRGSNENLDEGGSE
jgi:hypothetical protein|tara:strand:- start:42 stop:539 length:498 start_codon:yes stop_codon:yes gene_type:complete